jgi:hypothetical protein
MPRAQNATNPVAGATAGRGRSARRYGRAATTSSIGLRTPV